MDVWYTTTLICVRGSVESDKALNEHKVRNLVFVATFTLILLILFVPARAPQQGLWRLISPTEYTGNPAANMHGVYLLNGGTSGKGSGSGWMVGDHDLVFQWDGFSWIQNSLAPSFDCQLNSVNFGGPLNPLTSITSTSGWMVGGVHAGGSGGSCTGPVAYFWNGVGWTSYSQGLGGYGSGELKSVFLVQGGSSGSYITAFAVGNENGGADGSFWDWNGVPGQGGGWTHLASLSGTPMNSVYMTHCSGSPCVADDGIAVGNVGTASGPGKGVIFRWLATWVALTSPVSVNLNGVAMSSRTRGWAVGDACTVLQTTDGTIWTGSVSPDICGSSNPNLRSIVMLSSSEAWAVGDADASGATVLHGTSLDSSPQWTRIPVNQLTSSLSLNSVTFAASGGNLWAAGNSGVAAFCLSNCGSQSSAVWSTTTSPLSVMSSASPPAPNGLNSVFMISDSDGWAVGDPINPASPTILRWNGGSFSWTRAPFASPITVAPLYGVYLTDGSDGWAVGGDPVSGTATTLWYDGNTWTGRTVAACGYSSCILRSVYMVSSSNSWAVGDNGLIMHSTNPGTQFATFSKPVVSPLWSVFFDPSSGGQSGWAAGGDGVGAPVIVHTTNGGGDSWGTVLPNPGGAPNGVIIKSLFFQDSTHGWAAGTGSTILFYNGVSWNLVGVTVSPPFVGPIDIRGIFVLGGPPATDGWAVGVDKNNLPVTIHYTGSGWETLLTPSIPNTGTLNGLFLRSGTNGLSVGSVVNSNTATLDLVLHLDPPGGVVVQTTSSQTTIGGGGATTTSSSTSSSSTSVVSSTASSTSTSEAGTSSVVTSSSEVTSSTESGTSSSTSAATVTESSSSTTTPLVVPAIPGFPIESIIGGVALGLATLAVMRRRRTRAY